MKSLTSCLAALALLASYAHGATLHTDTFPSSTLDWIGTGSPAPFFVPTGGPMGEGDGYLNVTVSTGIRPHLATHNSNDSWRGSFSAIGATRINAALMSPPGAAPLQIRIVLFGSGGSRWTSTVPQSIPADGVWRNYTFSLAQADLTRAVGSDTYAQLMNGIERTMFRHQTGAPSAEGTDVVHPANFFPDLDINEADLTNPELGFNARFGVDLAGEDFLQWQRSFQAPLGVMNVDNVQLASGPAIPAPEPPASIAMLTALLALDERLRLGRSRAHAARPTA